MYLDQKYFANTTATTATTATSATTVTDNIFIRATTSSVIANINFRRGKGR